MLKKLKQIIPINTLQFLRKWRYIFNHSKFKAKSTKEVFTEIFQMNHWQSNESVSGLGSEFEQTKKLPSILQKIILEYSIQSILDIPCGDLNWMNNVDLKSVKYYGADIVDSIIERNNNLYFEKGEKEFFILNLINDNLPNVDLLFVRDCLVHLSYIDIKMAINNCKNSKSKYLLTTSFPKHSYNYNINTGDWRTIDLCSSPFFFPKPLLVFNEGYFASNHEFHDKSLLLWRVEDLPNFN